MPILQFLYNTFIYVRIIGSYYTIFFVRSQDWLSRSNISCISQNGNTAVHDSSGYVTVRSMCHTRIFCGVYTEWHKTKLVQDVKPHYQGASLSTNAQKSPSFHSPDHRYSLPSLPLAFSPIVCYTILEISMS